MNLADLEREASRALVDSAAGVDSGRLLRELRITARRRARSRVAAAAGTLAVVLLAGWLVVRPPQPGLLPANPSPSLSATATPTPTASRLGPSPVAGSCGGGHLQVTAAPPAGGAPSMSVRSSGSLAVLWQGALWVVANQGTAPRRLAVLPGDLLAQDGEPFLAWSPDGSSLVVRVGISTFHPGACSNLWVVPLDGTAPRAVSNNPAGVVAGDAAFAADGRLAYVDSSQRPATGTLTQTLRLVDNNGTATDLPCPAGCGGSAPSWSPDGRMLALRSSTGVQLVSLASGVMRTVPLAQPRPPGILAVGWTQDSSTLLVAFGPADQAPTVALESYDLDTGAVTVARSTSDHHYGDVGSALDPYPSVAQFSADGRTLLVTGGSTALYTPSSPLKDFAAFVVDVRTGATTQLLARKDEPLALGWASANTILTEGAGPGLVLADYRLGDGKMTTLATAPSNVNVAYAWWSRAAA